VSPQAQLAAFILVVIAAPIVGPRVLRWWRKGCDACRMRNIGTPTPAANVTHTCFPWRNPYKDRKGNIHEFPRFRGRK
jgi:hypothetical protein